MTQSIISDNYRASNSKVLYLISYFIIIDLLFLPLFPFIAIPNSLPIVLFSLFYFSCLKKDDLLVMFIILCLSVFLSTFVSLFYNLPSVYLMDNFKRALQLLSTFSYFFFFRFVFQQIDLKLKNIIIFFSIYILILITIFFYEPELYLNLTNTLYPIGASELGEFLFFLRFEYMFQDPNTAGYFILLVIFFGLENTKLNMHERFLLYLTSIMTVIATKSLGVTIAALVFYVFYFYKLYRNKRSKIRFKRTTFFSIIGISFFFLILYLNMDYGAINDAVLGYMDRLESNDNVGYRANIYKNITGKFTPFIIGQGYTLYNQGSVMKPHTDHFRMIYSYGIIAYTVFVSFFIKATRLKKIFYVIPAFFAFSINTLIDEQKFLGILLIFIAYTHAINQKDLNHSNKKINVGKE